MKMSIDDLKKWLKNKKVRTWKRAILLLCEVGHPMTNTEVARALGIHRASSWRTLRTTQIHYQVKPEMKKNKMFWEITPKGVNNVRKLQEIGLLPRRD